MASASDLAKIGASTAGASSPISIPLSGGPVVSGSNPVTSVNFGAFQVGGKGNSSSADLPTPSQLFSGSGALATSSPWLALAAIGVAAVYLLTKR